MSRRWVWLGAAGWLAGCATVPAPVPKAVEDAQAAFSQARAAQADVLCPDAYRRAQDVLNQAVGASRSGQDPVRVEDLAFAAAMEARIAAELARRKTVEQDLAQVQAESNTQAARLAGLQQQIAAQLAAQAVSAGSPAGSGPMTAAGSNPAASPGLSLLESLSARAVKLPQASAVLEARGLVLRISNAKLFEPQTSKLASAASPILDEVVALLRSAPDVRCRVEGHTAGGGEVLASNLLSQACAESVVNYFNRAGIPLDALRAVGVGAERPLGPDTTAVGREQNNRLEIILEPPAGEKPAS